MNDLNGSGFHAYRAILVCLETAGNGNNRSDHPAYQQNPGGSLHSDTTYEGPGLPGVCLDDHSPSTINKDPSENEGTQGWRLRHDSLYDTCVVSETLE